MPCNTMLMCVVMQGEQADAIVGHIHTELGQEALKDPVLVKQVALTTLRHAVQSPKV